MVVLSLSGPADNPEISIRDHLSFKAIWFWQAKRFERMGYRVLHSWDISDSRLRTWLNERCSALHPVAFLE